MSEDGGFLPAPVILDASVLIEAVRGDAGLLDLILGYDVAGQPLLMPALAVVAASLDCGPTTRPRHCAASSSWRTSQSPRCRARIRPSV